jgi:hypothetical protein
VSDVESLDVFPFSDGGAPRRQCPSVFAAAKVDAINQSHVVNDDDDDDDDARSTGANARAMHGVFVIIVVVVVVVAIERGNPAG